MNWHSLLNDLPDVSGILLAALGLAVVFVPEPIRALEAKPRVRWAIAVLLFAIGVAGMFSSHAQRRDSDIAQGRASKEIDDAQKAAISATAEASKAREAASAAQEETRAARQEARQAQDSLSTLINQRSKETTNAIVKLNSTTESSVKGIPRPRRIPQEIRSRLIADLSAHRGVVTINSIGGDGESMQFAGDWYDLLTQAGWTLTSGVNVIYTPAAIAGVRVTIRGEPIAPNERFAIAKEQSAAALARSLFAVTTSVTGQRQPDLSENATVLDIGVLPRPAQ